MKNIKNMLWNPAAMLLVLSIVLSGCATGQAAETEDEATQPPTEAAETEPVTLPADTGDLYGETDLDAAWDAVAAAAITWSGGGAQVTGAGATVSGSTVTISAAGTYVLEGVMSDGQIIVDAGKNDVVRLVLNGVSLHCSTSSPIWSKQAGKTVLILARDSENTVSDASVYTYAAGEDEPDAAIFSKDDLTITGSGSLKVTGNFNNGIGTKDVLRITGGQVSVSAANDGLRGRDAVLIRDGDFTIDAANDGIKANNDTDTQKGYIVLEGGDYTITAGCDGIQAETALTISGGDFAITTGGGAAAAPQRQRETWGTQAATGEEAESMKGLKAGASLTISGGDFAIDTQDDAVHSNGDLTMTGGTLEITTGDDGFHADGALTVSGGTIRITASYEGLEGATVDITGGDITIKSSDDGINAAGGTDTDIWGDSFAARDSYYIRISGGTIEIDADADGIDSNGSLTIEGGTVLIHGPTSGGDGALDADGAIAINGGTVIAVGAAQMHQAPGDTSTQPSLSVLYTANQAAGTALRLTDADGGIIAEMTSAKAYQAAVISAPGMTLGETYTLWSGETRLCDVTLTGTVTQVDETGAVATGGFGGFGGRGGGQRPGGTPSEGMEPPEGMTPPDGDWGNRKTPPGNGQPPSAPSEP